MSEWGRPISEYRGEFAWNFKEGFSREGRRLKPDERHSSDVRQLRLMKKKEQAEEELKRARETAQQQLVHPESAVMVDKYGDEYEVCETAKEAVERMIKNDHRLASKYQDYVKKLDTKLKPYGTSYDTAFMKSSSVFPSVKAYEMAAEEFEKNQHVFEAPIRQLQVKNAACKSDWTSKVTNYGRRPRDEETSLDYNSSHGAGMPSHCEESADTYQSSSFDGGESLREKWVERAHQELSRKFSADPRTTEELRHRGSREVPLRTKKVFSSKGSFSVAR